MAFSVNDYHPICQFDVELARAIKARELAEAERRLVKAKANERNARAKEIRALTAFVNGQSDVGFNPGFPAREPAMNEAFKAIGRLAQLS